MTTSTMQFGCAAWGFRETPLEQQLEITRQLGLDILELGIAGHENDRLQVDASESAIASVPALYYRKGVSLKGASTGNDFTQEEPVACLADLEKVMRVTTIAARLGAHTLRIFAGFSPAAEVTGARWDRMVLSLNAAVEHASRHGVTLAVETHGGVKAVPGGITHFHSTSTRPELLKRWLNEVSPQVRLLFDPANLGAVGMNEVEILDLYHELQPRIASFHLKDFKRVSATALEPCACGEGQLDWSKLMPEFRAFPGVGFLEYEMTGDIVDGLKRTLQAIA
jgi:sugar phosphate isomerase/epimerase